VVRILVLVIVVSLVLPILACKDTPSLTEQQVVSILYYHLMTKAEELQGWGKGQQAIIGMNFLSSATQAALDQNQAELATVQAIRPGTSRKPQFRTPPATAVAVLRYGGFETGILTGGLSKLATYSGDRWWTVRIGGMVGEWSINDVTQEVQPVDDKAHGLLRRLTLASKYIQDAKEFSLSHSETIAVVAAEIKRLSIESRDRAKLRGSPETLLTINPNGMSTEQILNAIRSANTLSPEGQELLKGHKVALDNLLLRVKRDQVTLLQIVPPAGTPTKFHEVAIAVLDLETAPLVSLVNVYASPRLFIPGPELAELPARFSQAEAQFVRVVDFWAVAQSLLPYP
jgi:hypothetical protein